MTIFSSKSTRSFFDNAISLALPDDAVEISHDLHASLLEGQVAGQIIDFDVEPPVLVDSPPASPEELAAVERLWRDERLLATDGVVSRHRDELEGAAATTLTLEQYGVLQQYRQALRKWPEAGDFPMLDHRPQPPDWLAEQLT